MAKLTIELDPETHQQLKRLAAKDERSLTQYIGRVLRKHAGTLTTNTTETTTETSSKPSRRSSIISAETEENINNNNVKENMEDYNEW